MYERLTKRVPEGIKINHTLYKTAGVETKSTLFMMVNRLAEYEDSGLSPEEVKALQQENEELQYKLHGVMHSVDKWLDETDSMDEVNRAAKAREVALQAIEALQQENEQLKTRLADCKHFANGIMRDVTEPDKVYLQADEIIGTCGEIGEKRATTLLNKCRELTKENSLTKKRIQQLQAKLEKAKETLKQIALYDEYMAGAHEVARDALAELEDKP